MSVTDVAATEHAVPVFPDQRVRYLTVKSDFTYTIRSGLSFNIRLQHTEDYWIVRETETGIFGQGADVLEAMRDFQRAVEQHLDILEQQDALSHELSWQLSYLRARVRR